MKIIPAIDLLNGKCVRLMQGDYGTSKTYSENPLEMARMFEDHGLTCLHLVDLDGAKNRKIENLRTLEILASRTRLHIDFGGGIGSTEDVQKIFSSGAHKVTVGSVAVEKPVLFMEWMELFGKERIILGADCRKRKIATNGWLRESDLDVLAFIRKFEEQGLRYCMLTDIEKDGMLSGPSFDLYKEILEQTAISLIASGGIATVEDLVKLKELGCTGAIVGKALYEGTINLKELRDLC